MLSNPLKVTHDNDVAWAFCRAHTAALAIRIVELEAVTYAFQHTFRAVRDAQVALVTDATGQAACRLGGVFETHVYFIKRGTPFFCGQGIAFSHCLTLEKM